MPRHARELVEAAIEKHQAATTALIAFLDKADGDADDAQEDEREVDIVDELHDGDFDLEPGLGSRDCVGYCGDAGALPTRSWDQTHWAGGGTSDFEEQCEDEGAEDRVEG